MQNTLYMSANNSANLVEDLEDSARSIFKSFVNNQFQANRTRCHFLLSTNEKVSAKVDSSEIIIIIIFIIINLFQFDLYHIAHKIQVLSELTTKNT